MYEVKWLFLEANNNNLYTQRKMCQLKQDRKCQSLCLKLGWRESVGHIASLESNKRKKHGKVELYYVNIFGMIFKKSKHGDMQGNVVHV